MVPDWAVGVVVVMGALFVMLALVVALGLWVVHRQDQAKDGTIVGPGDHHDPDELAQLKWLEERKPWRNGPGGDPL